MLELLHSECCGAYRDCLIVIFIVLIFFFIVVIVEIAIQIFALFVIIIPTSRPFIGFAV